MTTSEEKLENAATHKRVKRRKHTATNDVTASTSSNLARDALHIPEIAGLVAEALYDHKKLLKTPHSKQTEWSHKPLKALRLVNKTLSDAATRYPFRDFRLMVNAGRNMSAITSYGRQIQGLERISVSTHSRLLRSMTLSLPSFELLGKRIGHTPSDVGSRLIPECFGLADRAFDQKLGKDWLLTILKRFKFVNKVALRDRYQAVSEILELLAEADLTKVVQLELTNVGVDCYGFGPDVTEQTPALNPAGLRRLGPKAKLFLAGLKAVCLEFEKCDFSKDNSADENTTIQSGLLMFWGLVSGLRDLSLARWPIPGPMLSFDGLAHSRLVSVVLKEVYVQSEALQDVISNNEEQLIHLDFNQVWLTAGNWDDILAKITTLLPKLKEAKLTGLRYHAEYPEKPDMFSSSAPVPPRDFDYDMESDDSEIDNFGTRSDVPKVYHEDLCSNYTETSFGPLHTYRPDDRVAWSGLLATYHKMKTTGEAPAMRFDAVKSAPAAGRVRCAQFGRSPKPQGWEMYDKDGHRRTLPRKVRCNVWREFKQDELVDEEIWFCDEHQHLGAQLARWPWLNGRMLESKVHVFPGGDVAYELFFDDQTS